MSSAARLRKKRATEAVSATACTEHAADADVAVVAAADVVAAAAVAAEYIGFAFAGIAAMEALLRTPLSGSGHVAQVHLLMAVQGEEGRPGRMERQELHLGGRAVLSRRTHHRKLPENRSAPSSAQPQAGSGN